MLAYITAHGGVVAVTVSVLVAFNLVLTFVSQLLVTIGKSVPPGIAQALSILKNIIDWMTANLEHPAAPADGVISAAALSSSAPSGQTSSSSTATPSK